MTASARLASVDAFRGLTVAGMILVNNPGSWSHVYPPLRHAEWHGWTPTDLIFPFFLLIVGISIALSFSRRREEGRSPGSLYLKIVQRSAAILLIGWFLHLFPRFRFATMRIPGVLPRIAVCFLFGALIYLNLKTRGRIVLTAVFLAGYWAAMTFIPVPGFGAGDLSLEGNLASFVDAKLLSGHLYRPAFDPEGVLSTIPAIATVLIGTLAGDWLRSGRTIFRKTLGLFVSGIVLTIAGRLLHPLFPINKQLWTSTFVLFSAGAGLIVFGACYVLMDRFELKGWAHPFLAFGTNAIAVFAGSTFMVKALMMIRISEAGTTVNPMGWLYAHALSPLAGPNLGSLLFALLFVGLWFILVLPLYLKGIFLRV